MANMDAPSRIRCSSFKPHKGLCRGQGHPASRPLLGERELSSRAEVVSAGETSPCPPWSSGSPQRWERRKPGLGRSLGTVRGMAQCTGEVKQCLWERADVPAWKEELLHLFFPTSGCLPRSCPGHAGSSAGPCFGKEGVRELRQRRG